jgi:branched-chain amino acid transport system ATP-binding protein
MEALLDVEGLSVAFGGLTAVSEVSFGVPKGQIRAVIGPNGAGKTTLFNAITGYTRPSAGKVRLAGREITGLSPHAVAAIGVRRTFQNGGLFGAMTVLENVVAGLHSSTRTSLFGALFSLPSTRRAEAAALDTANATLGDMGLEALAYRPARDLSFGEQRRVEIARAIVSGARLLLLDEPAVGLSVTEREKLVTLLRRLAKRGIAILLVEHVLDLVMAVSDEILVLNFGKKIADGTPEQIRADKTVLEVYLGSG